MGFKYYNTLSFVINLRNVVGCFVGVGFWGIFLYVYVWFFVFLFVFLWVLFYFFYFFFFSFLGEGE